MKRVFLLTLIFLMAATAVFAGDNNSNLSTGYIRSLNRNSVMNNVDAAIYNPAGTTEMEKGFHCAIQNQFLFRNYSYSKTDVNFKYNGTPYTVNVPDGESDVNTYLFPTAIADYTGNNWSVFFVFDAPGGGGSIIYKPYATTSLALITKKAADYGKKVTLNLKAKSMVLGYNLGGAYNFFDIASVSATLRLLQAKKSIELKAGSISVMDAEYKALGISAIFGLNITPIKNLNIGMRYELPTKMEYKSDKKGSEDERHDFPAVFGLGIGYNVLPQLRLMADFNWNFYKQQADNIDGADPDDVKDPWIVGIAAEYNITDTILVSAGYSYTDTGVTSDSLNYNLKGVIPAPNPNPDLSRNVIGLGGEWEVIDGLKLELGYMAVIYNSQKDKIGIEYKKSIHALSVGVGYSF